MGGRGPGGDPGGGPGNSGSSGSSGSSGNSGGNSGGGRGNTGGGNLGSEMGTVGPGQGYGSGHSSTDSGGGGSGDSNAGASSSGYSDTFGDSLDAQSAAPDSRAGTSMTGMNAMVSMDDAAKQAQETFGTFAEQAATQMGPENVGYGNATYGGTGAIANASQAAAMTRGQHTQSLAAAGVPESHHAAARPGLLGRAVNLGLSIASPVTGLLGTAVSAHNAATNAQASIGALNDTFGTSLDDSYGTAIGQQALGSAAGTLGSKVGGNIGADVGMSVAGVNGAIMGGLLGAAGLGTAARGAAMGPDNGATGAQGPEAGGDGTRMIASNAPRPSAPTDRPGSGYVPVPGYQVGSQRDNPFDRYSDYAAQFFGTA